MGRISRTHGRHGSEAERGQLLVIFALAMVALVGAVGLVIDGGDTFLQRRDQQNATDAAAMAAGFAYLNYQSEIDAARSVAARNGFTNGSNGVSVNATVGDTSIVVTIVKPHRNYFSGVMGLASWDVSTTASVVAGKPNGAQGLLPLIFNEDAFNNPANRNPSAPASFGEPPSGSQDVPQDSATFNWTVYCTAGGSGGCNADSSTVESMITGGGQQTTVYLDDTIAPLNAGAHTTLYSDLAAAIGEAYPVAIVNDHGDLLGWSWFHITGSVGGGTKQVSGWFEDQVNRPEMTVVQGRGTAQGSFGAYTVKLIN